MGFSDSPVLLKVALVLIPIALLLDLVGVATPNWIGINVDLGSFYQGLWKLCGSSNGETQCVDYPEAAVEGWLQACRAFGIIGILAMAAASVLVMLCTFAFSKDSHKMVFIFTVISAIVGAASLIVAVIIWGVKTSDVESPIPGKAFSLSWSFGLSIAGAILSVIGGASVGVDLCQN